MSDESLMAALEKLGKWRKFFAGWQLGTRPDSDGESKAVRDHREVTILLRAEVTALTGLLISKGVITQAEYGDALEKEAEQLDPGLLGRLPRMVQHPGRDVHEAARGGRHDAAARLPAVSAPIL